VEEKSEIFVSSFVLLTFLFFERRIQEKKMFLVGKTQYGVNEDTACVECANIQ
jgi:hypothetical protein